MCITPIWAYTRTLTLCISFVAYIYCKIHIYAVIWLEFKVHGSLFFLHYLSLARSVMMSWNESCGTDKLRMEL